jgi:hypothetical protein
VIGESSARGDADIDDVSAFKGGGGRKDDSNKDNLALKSSGATLLSMRRQYPKFRKPSPSS